MIISLEEAKKIDPSLDQEDLDAFEQSIRGLTNNNFQNTRVRFENVKLTDPSTIQTKEVINGLRIGDTIELNYSAFNAGLYTVEQTGDKTIKVEGTPFLLEQDNGITATLVNYPADVKKSVKKLIAYDLKMIGKAGIKSESISRMSKTYYDVNSSENTDGYPSSLLSTLKKYEKMRWS